MIKDYGYRKMMLPKSDEYLLDILKHEKAYYEAAAIVDVENILLERGVNINVETMSYKKIRTNNFIPYFNVFILIGLVLSVLPFYINEAFNNQANSTNIYYLALIVVRITAALLCINLIKKYNIYKYFWLIVAMCIGGWAVIFVVIDCWLSGKRKRN